MATDLIPRYVAGPDSLTADDFETASIRSAAPSYTSDAPSYHSTVPNFEPVPPYSPRERPTASAPAPSSVPRQSTAPSLLPRAPEGFVAPGLPPIPPASSAPLIPSRRSDLPNLGAFRIPTWSNIATNPNARLYHSVAKRRAAAASTSSAGAAAASLKRIVLDRIEEEERARIRPLEDPYLVGEVAARQAREERLARENGDDILIMEDRRWDWFLHSQSTGPVQPFARPSMMPNRYNGPLRAAFM